MWRACNFELLAYLAMVRYSDLARIKMTDIQVGEDRLVVNFSLRKNDQTKQGHSVYILGTGGTYCPVRLFLFYQRILSDAYGRQYDGPVLPAIGKRNNIYFPDGNTASYSALRKIQKQVLMSINLQPSQFGLHSGRRRRATKSGQDGMQIPTHACLGVGTKAAACRHITMKIRK